MDETTLNNEIISDNNQFPIVTATHEGSIKKSYALDRLANF